MYKTHKLDSQIFSPCLRGSPEGEGVKCNKNIKVNLEMFIYFLSNNNKKKYLINLCCLREHCD